LGNVRLSYTNNNGVAQIIDENNFYPFGLRQSDNSSASTLNKNQYNGKEFQDELGLNLTAMDFRQYDNTLGRFNVIDPLAEQDYGITPYHFGYDNPVLFGDPSGLKAMAPESIENNMVPESVLSLLASGMSGKELTDYLFDQMWGFSMLSIHSGGGGGSGSSVDISSTIGLVQSLIDKLNSTSDNVHGVNWNSATGVITEFSFDKKYPGFYRVLVDLLPYVKNHPSVLQSLTKYSGYSNKAVLNLLSIGNLVTLVVVGGTNELGEFFGNKKLESFDPTHIHISSSIVSAIEKGFYKDVLDYETLNGISFLAGVTILHELVHYGRYWNNLSDKVDNKYEAGQMFEKEFLERHTE